MFIQKEKTDTANEAPRIPEAQGAPSLKKTPKNKTRRPKKKEQAHPRKEPKNQKETCPPKKPRRVAIP